ncbi:MAG TPA: hemolysin family protein [Chloroflexia bacterium]|nr:hemolysin family protein [Chloroflexia bacterium]
MSGWIEYLILILLVLLNAFFAASELAIVSARKTRIRQLADDGSRQARSVLRLSDNPGRFLATIQVGVTLTGFFASAFGAVSLVSAMEGLLNQVSFLAPVASTLSFIIVTVIIALFTLIFGELVPKTLAVEAAENIALTVARPIEVIAKIAGPIIAFLTGTTNLVVRLLGGKRKASTPTVTQEEVVSMVTAGQEEGVFQAQQEELIRSVFDFSEKRVREVMVPRPDVVMLDSTLSLAEAAKEILESDYSRYPVYTENRDNITGVIMTKDVLRSIVMGNVNTTLKDIARPPVFVPDSKHVSELFTELQTSRTHLTIVIDEYGSIAGVVTLEDLLEEIVGEIQDEFDHEENILTQVGEHEYISSGRASIFDLNQELDVELNRTAEGEKIDVDTLGGLVMAEMKRIPVVGDTCRMEFPRPERLDEDDEDYQDLNARKPEPLAVVLTVLEMDGLRINQVKIKLEYPQEKDNGPEPANVEAD